MNSPQKNEKLRQSKIAFLLNLALCIITLLAVFGALESQVLWKIIFSSVGFIGFLTMTILVFIQMIQLQKKPFTKTQ